MQHPERHAAAARYWAFVGQAGGVPVGWCTEGGGADPVAGVVPAPVMIGPPAGFGIGPSLVPGEPPPVTSTSIQVADPDGSIADMILPDVQGQQSLSGKLYLCDTTTGQATAMTPTLHIAGNATLSDRSINITLEADYSDILGRPIALWTLEELMYAEFVGIRGQPADWRVAAPGLSESGFWVRFGRAVSQNESHVVPHDYGGIMELVPVNGEYPRYWVAATRYTRRAGLLSDAWLPGPGELFEESGGVLSRVPSSNRHRPLPFAAHLRVRDKLGVTRDVDLLFFCYREQDEDWPAADRYVCIPQRAPEVRPGPTTIPPPWGIDPLRYGSPAAMVGQLVRDQSARGEDALGASFQRAIRDTDPSFGDICAGVLGGENVTLAEVFQHITPICSLRLWVGPDDKLHAGVPGYTFEDQQAARGELLHLDEADVFPRDTNGTPEFTTEIVGDIDDDSAGVTRVSVEWDEDQRRFFPVETAATMPTLGGPVAGGRERILSGAWLRADAGAQAAASLQAAASGDAIRVKLATHITLGHVLTPGQLIRVSHKVGLGFPGLGWDQRLCRVEHVQVEPGEDAIMLTLADLGPAERMRIGRLDTWDQWIVHRGEAPLALQRSGGQVRLVGVASEFPEVEPGMSVWTPGMGKPENRRGWRVLSVSGADVIVQHHPGSGDDLSSQTPDFDWGWAVARTDVLDPDYRWEFIRGCDLGTSMFESGERGFRFTNY